jgi:hypothetical protein
VRLPQRQRVQAEEHLYVLAQKHRITLRWMTFGSGKCPTAHLRTRQVWVPRVRTPQDYVMGLHEIGHVVSRVSRSAAVRLEKQGKNGKGEHELVMESAAWGWAIDNGIRGILMRMSAKEWRSVGMLLLTYMTRRTYPSEEEAQAVNPVDDDGYPL